MTITAEQRQIIHALANKCCEYCRVAQDDRLSKFQIDHIIPVKHGGTDATENLCLACLKCNSFKGPNVAALDPATGEATKLYNPRQQSWEEHFQINPDASLIGISPEGRATIIVLRINEGSRVKQRRVAMNLGEYPCTKA
ncbi:MAG: HNH endonuclease [Anaerolineae bacterium]|nr:HNH endonuclease [Anaerolineae bacterium]